MNKITTLQFPHPHCTTHTAHCSINAGDVPVKYSLAVVLGLNSINYAVPRVRGTCRSMVKCVSGDVTSTGTTYVRINGWCYIAAIVSCSSGSHPVQSSGTYGIRFYSCGMP